MLEIVLAGPPRGKGRPRFRVIHGATGSFGSAYTDAKTRKYEDQLRDAAAAVMFGRAVLDEPLSVVVEAHMPLPASWSRVKRAKGLAGELMPTGRPDADNLVKVLDALNKVVWRDDSLIIYLGVLKQYATEPRLCIKVRPWNE